MPARSPEMRRKIAAAGGAAKHRKPDAAARKAELAVARIEEYVSRVVASSPPLTERQRRKIASILDSAPAEAGTAKWARETAEGMARAAEHVPREAGGDVTVIPEQVTPAVPVTLAALGGTTR
jgi:hypothetical protein